MNKVAIDRDGQLAYDEFNCTTPWKPAETVVLVHGFTKNRLFWHDWIPELCKHYRVINVDQRGHGDSSPLPPDYKMVVRDFSDDMASFAKALKIERAHFVMAEFTSAIALDFAVAYPALIQSLVLPGLVYKAGNSVDWEGWATLVDTKGSIGWARATNEHRLPAGVDPNKREWYVTQQGRFAPGPLANFFRIASTVDMSGNLPKITAPTLLITGEHAKVQSAADVVAAARAMPHGVAKVIEGMPLNVMSAAPQEALKVTLEFLKALGEADAYAKVRPRGGQSA